MTKDWLWIPLLKSPDLNFILNLNLEEVMRGVFTGNFQLLRKRSEKTSEEAWRPVWDFLLLQDQQR